MVVSRSFGAFASRMAELGEEIVIRTSKVRVTGAKAIMRTVVPVTPIDTGETVSNWLASKGTPRTDVIASRRPGSKGSTRGAVIAATIRAGNDALRGKLSPKTEVFVVNNTKVIGFLNAGSSAQAPAGFVEDALIAASRAVRRTRLNLGGTFFEGPA